MKNSIKLEEIGMFAVSVLLLYKLNFHISWWLYPILFFSPDIGILGYIANARIGAFSYNLFHHKAIAAILLIIGIFQSIDYLLFAGLILFAHSSFDRILGFGLKYPDSFNHTSLDHL